MEQQMTIFDFLYEDFKIAKPIRLIELFAGYGSQNLALKYLGANYKHYKICEWATKSIQAYNDLHIRDYTDYSVSLTFEKVVNFLYNKGISFDYNVPMTRDQIEKRGDKWCRNVYNNIIATDNLVNIQQVHASNLNIYDTKNFTYLLTYSFPCQDLSLAGDKKGMEKGSGTRSGLLWEVERILKECKELPQVLLMENVPQVHSQDNVDNFKLWIRELEKLGYTNYWEDLNAKDYGIPQNRNRTFMVSILGQYNYNFPVKQKLELKLKDMLEENVDGKYYLTPEKIEAISHWKAQQDPLKNIEYEKEISPTLTARGAGEEHSGMILINENAIPIKNATSLGYTMAEEGDGVDIGGRMEYHRGTVQKGMTQTIKTSCENGVVVKEPIGCEIRTDEGVRTFKDNCIGTLRTIEGCGNKHIIEPNLRIRKLTPRESLRLMGVKDKDIDNISNNQTETSIYHLSGDSIVVNVLMAIFKEML